MVETERETKTERRTREIVRDQGLLRWKRRANTEATVLGTAKGEREGGRGTDGK
jgi:hypothetical protein